MTIGGSVMSCLFGGYWVLTRHVLKPGDPWAVHALSCVGVCIFMSNALVVGSLFKSLVLTCRQGKGAAVGAAKAFVGIGAGVYTCLFDSMRHESDLDFLLLAAFFAMTCIAAPGFFLLPSNRVLKHVVDVSTATHYRIIYSGLLFLAVTILGSSALFMFRPLPGSMSALYLPDDEPIQPRMHRAMLLLAGWFVPIVSLFFLEPLNSVNEASGEKQPLMVKGMQREPSRDIEDDDAHVDDNNDDEIGDDVDGDGDVDTVYDPPRISERALSIVVEDLSFTQMLLRPSAWLLLLSCTFVVGSGTMITNNMSQMVESLGFPRRATPACLSIFSVSQATARAVTGYVSDSVWKQRQVPRTVFVVISTAVGMAGHLVLAFGDDRPCFVSGVILVGISFGMMWPLMVLIVGDLYGKRYHGANYLFYDGVTSAMGTLLIAKYITQYVYESNLDAEDEITCYGKSCFAASHASVALLCFVAFLSAIATMVMTRRNYRPTSYWL
jgi:hypothetical protein